MEVAVTDQHSWESGIAARPREGPAVISRISASWPRRDAWMIGVMLLTVASCKRAATGRERIRGRCGPASGTRSSIGYSRSSARIGPVTTRSSPWPLAPASGSRTPRRQRPGGSLRCVGSGNLYLDPAPLDANRVAGHFLWGGWGQVLAGANVEGRSMPGTRHRGPL